MSYYRIKVNILTCDFWSSSSSTFVLSRISGKISNISNINILTPTYIQNLPTDLAVVVQFSSDTSIFCRSRHWHQWWWWWHWRWWGTTSIFPFLWILILQIQIHQLGSFSGNQECSDSLSSWLEHWDYLGNLVSSWTSLGHSPQYLL